MRLSSTTIACGLAGALAACGSVNSQRADAGVDAWLSNCAPVPEITEIEAADAGFGNDCIHGFWYLEALNGTTVPDAPGSPDHSAEVVPTALPLHNNGLDESSTFAVHVTGSGQENMGSTFAFAQLTAALNAPSPTQLGSVNAASYTGVQFYAIVKTAATGARFTVANLYTDPAGGRCTTEPGQKTSCFDHPGFELTITTTWTQYQIPFANLVQLGFGNTSPTGAAFPKDAITLFKWDIGIPTTGPTALWELWVDDLKFY